MDPHRPPHVGVLLQNTPMFSAVLVAAGLTNAEIAVGLHLSEATVKTHISRILAKLSLGNRVQAAILAHHAGLLE